MKDSLRTALSRLVWRRPDPRLGLLLLVLLPSALFVGPWLGHGPCVDEAQMFARVHPDVIGFRLSDAIRSVAARCCSVGDRPVQELWSWLFVHRMHLSLASTQALALLLHFANLTLVWCVVRWGTSSWMLALAAAALGAASQYSLWTSIDVAATNETQRAFFLLSAMAAVLHAPTAWLRTSLAIVTCALALVSKETSLCCFPAICLASWHRGRWEFRATTCMLFVLGGVFVARYHFPSTFDSADAYSLMSPIGSAVRAIRSMWAEDWPLGLVRCCALGLGGLGVWISSPRRSASRDASRLWRSWAAFAVLTPIPYLLVRGSQLEPYYYLWNLASWVAGAVFLHETMSAFDVTPRRRTIAAAIATPVLVAAIVLHGSATFARGEVRACVGIRETMGAVLDHIAGSCSRLRAEHAPSITYVGVGAPDMAGKDNLAYLPLLACGTSVKSFTSFVLEGGRHQVLTTAETSDRLMAEVDPEALDDLALRTALGAERTQARIASCPGAWGRVCVVDEDGGGQTIVVNFVHDR